MENLTLVVMAGGLGSRFGGLKQIEPVDSDGNFLIDYSVFDAKMSGFNKVVFVIKEELEEDFKKTIGKRLEGKIEVCYAFQRKEDIPYEDKSIVKEREKPWGTAQAIMASKPYVDGNFAVINADDFYGLECYQEIVKFFREDNNKYSYISVPFEFRETSSLEGAVKRGVCKIEDNLIKDIKECSIKEKDAVIRAEPLDGGLAFEILPNTLVSMNIFGFKYDFFELLEEYLKEFFEQDKDVILKSEALLPECLDKYLKNKKIKIWSRPTTSKWIGMTYKSDLPLVKEEIEELKKAGKYPEKLWE